MSFIFFSLVSRLLYEYVVFDSVTTVRLVCNILLFSHWCVHTLMCLTIFGVILTHTHVVVHNYSIERMECVNATDSTSSVNASKQSVACDRCVRANTLTI